MVGTTTIAASNNMGSGFSMGKAVLSFHYYNHETYTAYYVSNITDKPVDVSIIFYNSDGTIKTDDNNQNDGYIKGNIESLNYSEQTPDTSATFSLAPHATTCLIIQNPLSTDEQEHYGNGVIKWSQESNNLQSLVVHSQVTSIVNNSWSRFAIDVNSGMPF